MRQSRAAAQSVFAIGFVLGVVSLGWPQPLGAQAAAPSSTSLDIVIQYDVAMKTRDGITLYADIYRPKSSDRFPVIVMRTPYDKSVNWAVSSVFQMVPRGYMVVIHDVRGRYRLEGEWYPFRHEQADGFDTVEWAAALPFSDGKVGMMGGSYVGATQMLAAIAQPPHLVAIAPNVTASNYHDGWTYQGGAFEQWFDQNWTSQLAQNTLQRLIDQNTNGLVGVPTLPLANYPVFNFGQLPADAQLTAAIAPYYLDWLAHPAYADYWKPVSIEENFPRIAVPMLQVGGWYDIFCAGTLRNYMGAKAHGPTEAARTQQHLLIEIGGHAGFGRRIGDVDFGPHATENGYTNVILDWYDFLCKGIKNEFATHKPVKLFVMGANEYRQEDDWPLPQAQPTKYFLHSAGKENSLRGDGFAQDLTERILRMRYRASPEHAVLMNPRQIYEISLDLWATSNVFLRGHSLRLEISSGNFPRFDRNLNAGEEIKFARTLVSATNTILHDAQHPSALVLPVVLSKWSRI